MRSRAIRFVLAMTALLAPAGARASDGDIRIFFDANQCSAQIPCGESRLMYVYAELAGATANGITGVEYSIRIGPDTEPDPGWVFEEEWAPGVAIALGSGAFFPPDNIQPRMWRRRGINAAWSTCQTGERGLVLIETVTVTNNACSGRELRLLVWEHDRPANEFFRCPLATLCDAEYTKVCLGSNVMECPNPEHPRGPLALCSTSSGAVINPTDGLRSPCTGTPVHPTTWGGVKGMYRN